jgi:hypothetical protein
VFRLADAGALSSMLGSAGFEGLRIEEVPVHFVLADVDEYLSLLCDTAGPIGLTIRGLSVDDRTSLAAASGEQLERYGSAEGLDVPGLALCATAA